jgi:hypothetical protein
LHREQPAKFPYVLSTFGCDAGIVLGVLSTPTGVCRHQCSRFGPNGKVLEGSKLAIVFDASEAPAARERISHCPASWSNPALTTLADALRNPRSAVNYLAPIHDPRHISVL